MKQTDFQLVVKEKEITPRRGVSHAAIRLKKGVFESAIESLVSIQGITACAIAEVETGSILAGADTRKINDLESATLLNARLLRAQMRVECDHPFAEVEDVLITRGDQYHLIHVILQCPDSTSKKNDPMFAYLVLNRNFANTVLTRRKLKEIATTLVAELAATAWADPDNLALLRVPGGKEKIDTCSEAEVDEGDELPPFMRDDVALKLLGIDPNAIPGVCGAL